MVFVDDMNAPYGRLIMCHMVADTHEELIHMASKIGVALRHIQSPHTPREHFDICLSKRRLAIAAGAIPIRYRDLPLIMAGREMANPTPPTPLPPPRYRKAVQFSCGHRGLTPPQPTHEDAGVVGELLRFRPCYNCLP